MDVEDKNDLAPLLGMRVQRVDGPAKALVALTLHGRGLHGVLLLHVRQRGGAWGWLADRPRGQAASAFIGLLRKHLVGSKLTDLVSEEPAELRFVRQDDPLILRWDRKEGRLTLVKWASDSGEQILGTLSATRSSGSTGRGAPLASTLDDLITAGEATVVGLEEDTRALKVASLQRASRKRIAKIRRRRKAIEGDLRRIEAAPTIRERASMILANLGQISAGAVEVELMNWHVDPPRLTTVEIDPKVGPKRHAEALFQRARKLDRAKSIALARLADAESDLRAADDDAKLLNEAADKRDDAYLDTAVQALGLAQPTPKGNTKNRGSSEQRPEGFHRITGHGGRKLLVGKNAAGNDQLTLHVSRPWDLWLHARSVTGSHVIIPLAKGESCPPELLVDGATLAAHFSQAKGEHLVEVQYVLRRHVRKPKGNPPGAVRIEREKVLLLKFEKTRLNRLLGRARGD